MLQARYQSFARWGERRYAGSPSTRQQRFGSLATGRSCPGPGYGLTLRPFPGHRSGSLAHSQAPVRGSVQRASLRNPRFSATPISHSSARGSRKEPYPLYEFAMAGHKAKTAREVAIWSLLAHLFEKCTIFEDAPVEEVA